MTAKHRSFRQIMHHITSFGLTLSFDGGGKLPGRVTFTPEETRGTVCPGDLVSLSSAPVSEWYLSWVVEFDANDGYPRYLLESIETGKLCWWHNVSVHYMDRQQLADFPHWRWTDRQWAFKDRWWKVCYKRYDAYLTLPLFPVFGDDGLSVTLGTRKRWNEPHDSPSRRFVDFRKVTMKMMEDFYNECVRTEKAGAA